MVQYTTIAKVRYTDHNWTDTTLPTTQGEYFIKCADAIIDATAKTTFTGNAVTDTIVEHCSTLLAGLYARGYDPTQETISAAGFSANIQAYLVEIMLKQLEDSRVIAYLKSL